MERCTLLHKGLDACVDLQGVVVRLSERWIEKEKWKTEEQCEETEDRTVYGALSRILRWANIYVAKRARAGAGVQ